MNKIAIYPGTFDPITLGHVDIAARASALFDRVVLAVAANAGGTAAFSREERVELARLSLAEYRNVEVRAFDTLVTELAQRLEARFLIRGLRAVSDFDYEFQMAAMNRCLLPELETLFLMPAERFNYLSSSVVREIVGLGGDVGDFVPEAVLQALQRRLPAAARPPDRLRGGQGGRE